MCRFIYRDRGFPISIHCGERLLRCSVRITGRVVGCVVLYCTLDIDAALEFRERKRLNLGRNFRRIARSVFSTEHIFSVFRKVVHRCLPFRNTRSASLILNSFHRPFHNRSNNHIAWEVFYRCFQRQALWLPVPLPVFKGKLNRPFSAVSNQYARFPAVSERHRHNACFHQTAVMVTVRLPG